MCKAVEDYVKEREEIAKVEATAVKATQIVDNLINKGFSLEEALKIVDIDEETYNKYKVA